MENTDVCRDFDALPSVYTQSSRRVQQHPGQKTRTWKSVFRRPSKSSILMLKHSEQCLNSICEMIRKAAKNLSLVPGWQMNAPNLKWFLSYEWIEFLIHTFWSLKTHDATQRHPIAALSGGLGSHVQFAFYVPSNASPDVVTGPILTRAPMFLLGFVPSL